jgi:hypothetical protein
MAMMNTRARSSRRTLVVASLLALALGDMGGCSHPTGPTSAACTQETVFNAHNPIPASTFLIERITTNKIGRLELSLDWLLDANIISMVLTQAPCSLEQFKADQCNVILNLFPPPKPLTGSTFWLSPGTYDLILGNFGSLSDIASTNITLRTTGCPTAGEE